MEKNLLLLLRKRYVIFFTLVFLITCNVSYALPFTIIPTPGTSLPTTIGTGSAVTAYYTVFNNTVTPRNNNFVKYLPPHVSQVTTGGVGTCGTLFNLAAKGKLGDSCILQLMVSGPVNARDPNPHHHLFVCFPGGNTCAGTLFPLNLTISEITPPPPPPPPPPSSKTLFAFITNGAGSGANTITTCRVLANGDFAPGCTVSGAGLGLDNPTDIVFNSQGTLAYITNNGGTNNDVSVCSFDTNGNLTSCNSAGTGIVPTGITINSTGTFAYISDIGTLLNGDVYKCGFNGSGSLVNCTPSGVVGTSFPVGITINPAGTLIYIANASGGVTSDGDVTKCGFAGNGNLTNCSNSGSNFLTPIGIAINAAGTRMYVVNINDNSVTKCEFAVNGDLTNCVDSGATTLSGPEFITFSPDGAFVYIANSTGNNVTKCAIDGTGNLINCLTTGDNTTGSTGIKLQLV